MSLKDRLAKAPVRFITVDQLLEQLEGDELKITEAALYDSAWSTAKLFQEIRDEGYPISENEIRRWRRQHDVG